MKFLKNNWSSCLTALFLIVIGVLLLYNPATYSMFIIRAAGILLIALGLFDVIKYFRATPEDAAKGSGFYSGAIMITAGIFCIISINWFITVFPILAVIYGLLQILLGYRKLQRTVDALRMKMDMWWMRGISAAISLLFGFIIVLNPEMSLISIWLFTGITLLLEGIFDIVVLCLQWRKSRTA